MNEYYAANIKLNDNEHNLIWYTDVEDGFIVKDGKPVCFGSQAQLESYAKQEGISLKDGVDSFDFDSIVKWFENPNENIDCVLFLDGWNLLSDMAKSVSSSFLGDLDDGLTLDVYNILFYGNNVPALRKDGEKYIPKWDEDEIRKLKNVLENGIALFNEFVQ